MSNSLSELLAAQDKNPREIVRFVLHCLSGLIAVIAHYGVMYLCLALGGSATISTSIGFLVGALAKFLLSYHHVFSPNRAKRSAALHFVISLGVQFLLNLALFSFLLELGAMVWVAQVMTTIILTGVNYAMYRLWVFA